MVGLTLAITVQDFVLALQSRHAAVGERHPLSGVFQCRPNHVPQSCSLRRHCHGFCFRHFLLWREVRPEKGYAKGRVGAFECSFQALWIVYVRTHNFSTQPCKTLCYGAIHIPSEHARGESTIRVVKDRPDQTSALRTGCSHHCDNFSVAHCDLLSSPSAITPRVCLKWFDYSVSNSYQIAQTVRLRLLLEATLRNRNLGHL